MSGRLLAVAAASLATVAALAAAGCGGSSTPTKQDYAAAVQRARDRVDFALARITQSKTKDQFLDQMVDSSVLIDDAVDDLDKTGAADGLATIHDKLVSSLRQLAVDLEQTSEQIRTPGYEGLFNARGLSFKSWDDANAALAALKVKGIDVEPLGRH